MRRKVSVAFPQDGPRGTRKVPDKHWQCATAKVAGIVDEDG